jgi:hypothetical protein
MVLHPLQEGIHARCFSAILAVSIAPEGAPAEEAVVRAGFDNCRRAFMPDAFPRSWR